MQYIASQSTQPQPAQPQQEANKLQTVITPSIHGSISATQPQPSSSSQSTKSTSEEDDDDETEEAESSENLKFPTTSNEQKATLTIPSEEKAMQVDKVITTTSDENGRAVTTKKHYLG